MRAETPILTASAVALCNTLSDVYFSPQADWEVRIGVILSMEDVASRTRRLEESQFSLGVIWRCPCWPIL